MAFHLLLTVLGAMTELSTPDKEAACRAVRMAQSGTVYASGPRSLELPFRTVRAKERALAAMGCREPERPKEDGEIFSPVMIAALP